jgi:hypothetical protein
LAILALFGKTPNHAKQGKPDFDDVGDFGLFLQILRLDHPGDSDGFPRTAHGVDFPESTLVPSRSPQRDDNTPKKQHPVSQFVRSPGTRCGSDVLRGRDDAICRDHGRRRMRFFTGSRRSFFWDSQDVKKVSPLSGSPENVIRGPLDDDESLRCK